MTEQEQKVADEQLLKMRKQREELRDNLEKEYKQPNIKKHPFLSEGIHFRGNKSLENNSDAVLNAAESVSKLDTPTTMSDEEIQNIIDEEVARRVANQLVVKIQYIEKIEEKEIIKVETKTIIEKQFVKRQTISIISLYNSTLKDLFAANFVHVLAKDTKQRILIIDFDSPFPSLDYAFNVDTAELRSNTPIGNIVESGVTGCINALRKNQLNPNSFPSYSHKVKGYSNLYILTGLFNIDIYDTVSTDELSAIIDCAEQVFDTVIITLNSSIDNAFTFCGIKKSNSILIITQPLYANARKDIDCITEITEKQGVNKDFINVIEWGNLFDKDTINSLYKGYKVLGAIPDNYSGSVVKTKFQRRDNEP